MSSVEEAVLTLDVAVAPPPKRGRVNRKGMLAASAPDAAEDFLPVPVVAGSAYAWVSRRRARRAASAPTLGRHAELAHEMRNPLAGIRCAAQLLKGATSVSEDRALAELIIRETDRVARLLGRLEMGDGVGITGRVRPSKVISQTIDLLANSFSNVAFSLECEEDACEIDGDEDALRQVFLNLLKNAAEAAVAGERPPAVRVCVAAPRARPAALVYLQVTVTDTGLGVPAAIRAFLFMPYNTTKVGGSGLGLAVTASLLAGQGGCVFLNDGSDDTQFVVQLSAAGADGLRGSGLQPRT